MDNDENVDLYELLDLESTASLKEITTAYRKKSLSVHPDRNPDNPQAAELFHQLAKAYDILKDPGQRQKYDTEYNAAKARKARFAKLDSQRQSLAQDLKQREKAFQDQQKDQFNAKLQREAKLAKLKQESQALRQKRQQEVKERTVNAAKRAKTSTNAANGPSKTLGPLDTSVRLKWQRKKVSSLDSKQAVEELASKLGQIDHVVMTTDPSDTSVKTCKSLVAFKTLSAAVRAVENSCKPDSLWEFITVTWAKGSPPEVLTSSSTMPTPTETTTLNGGAKPTTIQGQDEDSVMENLRQKERERLEEEIRRVDEAEEGS